MDNLRILREENHITQVRLSVEIGVSQETISAYESGKALPSVETLCKMANFLNVSTDYLLDRTSIKLPANQISFDDLSATDIEIVTMVKRMNTEQKSKVIGYFSCLLEK